MLYNAASNSLSLCNPSKEFLSTIKSLGPAERPTTLDIILSIS